MPLPYEGYTALKVRLDRGVAFVTIDHPPINLLDLLLIQELDRMGRELEVDDAVRVVILQSADAVSRHLVMALFRNRDNIPEVVDHLVRS